MDAEEEDGTYVEDWSELSVSELREELKARGLDSTGNKTALVARLEEDDGAPESDAKEPTPVEPPEPTAQPETAVSAQPETATVYYAEFEVPDDFDPDDEEWDLSWKLEARAEALTEGHEVFPAAYAASLLAFAERDGKRVVVYQVPLKG